MFCAFDRKPDAGRRNRLEEMVRLLLDALSLRCCEIPRGDVQLVRESETWRRGLSQKVGHRHRDGNVALMWVGEGGPLPLWRLCHCPDSSWGRSLPHYAHSVWLWPCWFNSLTEEMSWRRRPAWGTTANTDNSGSQGGGVTFPSVGVAVPVGCPGAFGCPCSQEPDVELRQTWAYIPLNHLVAG